MQIFRPYGYRLKLFLHRYNLSRVTYKLSQLPTCASDRSQPFY